jgi:DnaK suppressor protein
MDQQDIDTYREHLEQRREELLRDMGRHQMQGRDIEIEQDGDRGDRAAGELVQDVEFGAAENQQMILRQVEEALRQIEEGEYGVCQVCGEEIEADRLNAVPWATRCLEDQKKQEGDAL